MGKQTVVREISLYILHISYAGNDHIDLVLPKPEQSQTLKFKTADNLILTGLAHI